MPMTPGSWYLTKEHLGIQGPDAHRICANPNGYGANYPDRWNWEANARAIAALPDLIEASEAVLERFLRTFDDRNSVNWFFYSEMASLRDALIKAGITT